MLNGDKSYGKSGYNMIPNGKLFRMLDMRLSIIFNNIPKSTVKAQTFNNKTGRKKKIEKKSFT